MLQVQVCDLLTATMLDLSFCYQELCPSVYLEVRG